MRPNGDTERTRQQVARRRLAIRAPRMLEIDASDSADAWRKLIETIEALAREGQTIDCSRQPLDVFHASTPLREAVTGRRPPCDEEAEKTS